MSESQKPLSEIRDKEAEAYCVGRYGSYCDRTIRAQVLTLISGNQKTPTPSEASDVFYKSRIGRSLSENRRNRCARYSSGYNLGGFVMHMREVLSE